MLHLQRIEDLEQLQGRPFQPPEHLLDEAEEAEARGEPWWALEARPEGAEEPLWLCVFPEREAADALYLFGDLHLGRWDAARQVFEAEEGGFYDLRGRSVTPGTLEDEEEEEDAGWEGDLPRREDAEERAEPGSLDQPL